MVGDYTAASIMHSTIISFFILCSLYKESLSVRFKVLSAASVSVTFGSDVVLPCRLTPEMNAEKMEIRWFKPMYQPYVHLCINGKDDYSIQMPQFTNRTELIKENITRGVFPLMIHNVTAQDSGEYYCFVESSEHHGKATVQLHVTGKGLRNNSTRFIITWPSVAVSLISFLCICLQALNSGEEGEENRSFMLFMISSSASICCLPSGPYQTRSTPEMEKTLKILTSYYLSELPYSSSSLGSKPWQLALIEKFGCLLERMLPTMHLIQLVSIGLWFGQACAPVEERIPSVANWRGLRTSFYHPLDQQSVRFKVLSVSSVSVPIGSDATLHCYLVPEMNAENMEINWFKPSYIPYVHMYNRGEEDKSKQMEQFVNRTEFLKQNITRGGVALLIRKVTFKDLGKYYCYFESDYHHGRTIIQLNGTAIGTAPNILYSEQNDFVVCNSSGWFPQPHVTWTDSAGNLLNASWTEVLREGDLFGVTSVIPLIPGSNITCTVTNDITESRQSSALIPVPTALFCLQRSPSNSHSTANYPTCHKKSISSTLKAAASSGIQ